MSGSEGASGTAETVDVDEADVSSSGAFAALADDVKTAILEALADDEPLSFSELFDASPADTTAGYA